MSWIDSYKNSYGWTDGPIDWSTCSLIKYYEDVDVFLAFHDCTWGISIENMLKNDMTSEDEMPLRERLTATISISWIPVTGRLGMSASHFSEIYDSQDASEDQGSEMIELCFCNVSHWNNFAFNFQCDITLHSFTVSAHLRPWLLSASKMQRTRSFVPSLHANCLAKKMKIRRKFGS